MTSITGSILRRFSFLELSTADEKHYTLHNTFATRVALSLIGVPHLGFRARARAVLGAAKGLPQGVQILDAGCGYGLYTLTLAASGRRVDAIDVDPERIATLTTMLEETPDLRGRISLRTASLTALPFEKASYDFIICSEVVEHIPDDGAALNELARVLKPGGNMVLTVPYPSTHNKKIFRTFGHERPGYTEEDLQLLLTVRGLAIKHTSYYEYNFGGFLFDLFNKIHSKPLMGLLFYPFYALYLLDAWLGIGEPNQIVTIVSKPYV